MTEAEKWDARYAVNDTPWDTGAPSTELMRVVAQTPIHPCRTIELGCGTGTNAIWLAEQGFDVTAVDVSARALAAAHARQAGIGTNVRFLLADLLRDCELGGPFDFVFDRGCYHVLRRVNLTAFMANLKRLVGSNTVGLFLTGNAKERHDPGAPVVSEEEIRRELGALFEIACLREFRLDQVEAGGLHYLAWSCLARAVQGDRP